MVKLTTAIAVFGLAAGAQILGFKLGSAKPDAIADQKDDICDAFFETATGQRELNFAHDVLEAKIERGLTSTLGYDSFQVPITFTLDREKFSWIQDIIIPKPAEVDIDCNVFLPELS